MKMIAYLLVIFCLMPVMSFAMIDRESSFTKSDVPMSHKEWARLAYQRAVEFVEINQMHKAETILAGILKVLPQHHASRSQLALIYLNDEREHEALDLLRRGLDIQPDNSEFLMLEAKLLTQGGESQLALDLLSRVPKKDKGTSDFMALQASALYHEGMFDLALQRYHQLIHRDRGQARWWLGLALCHEALGHNTEAFQSFQRVARYGGLGKEVMAYANERVKSLAREGIKSS